MWLVVIVWRLRWWWQFGLWFCGSAVFAEAVDSVHFSAGHDEYEDGDEYEHNVYEWGEEGHLYSEIEAQGGEYEQYEDDELWYELFQFVW